MLDCLIDYIGLGYPQGVYMTSDSGLYLVELPGITVVSVDKIADSEQHHYHQVWADVQKQAALRFESDVTAQINKCFDLNAYCDIEDLVCDNLDVLARPWMYLLGNQFMIERIYSPRLNRFTTVDAKQAAELRDFYRSEYDEAIQRAVPQIDVSGCEVCCNDNPKTVTWLP